ncbi:MAG: ABC transporter permease [Verrucomicrobiales bacterium]
MNLRVIYALVLRYVFLYTRNWVRLAELIFWPAMELITWGFLTVYLDEKLGAARSEPFTWLLGGVIFWDVMFRSQQGVAVSFLEDVWTRNLVNVFVAPVRPVEYLAAAFGVGLLRIAVTVLILWVLAWTLYQFNLLSLGPALVPFFANLLVFGWSIGIFSTALIMRYGQAAESLAWAVPFLIQPITAVYYPVSVMPGWLQHVAFSLPSTHVFEGMRQLMKGGGFSWLHFAWSAGLNLTALALAGCFYAWTLAVIREKGLLTKVSTN